MTGTTPAQRAASLRKILWTIYDDGKGADLANVVDCLTDLRHLCLTYHIDFFRADRAARDHAMYERQADSVTECECPRTIANAEGRN